MKKIICILLLLVNFIIGYAQTTLPVSRTSWATTPSGWTDSPLQSYLTTFACTRNDGGKFQTTGDNNIVFFNSSPNQLTFTVKSNNAASTSVLLVEESSNGIVWTSVVSLTGIVGLSTICSPKGPYTLLATSRYVKWSFIKGSSNMTWDDILITNAVFCSSPSISTQPMSYIKCIGNAVTFSVTATCASGAVSYQWRKAGTNIAGANSSTYTIPSIISTDASNYDVVVTCGCGANPTSTSNLVSLTVNSLPLSPTIGINTTTETQITWSWNVVAGATGYKYNTVNNYATATDNGNVISFTQNGLTCNTLYTLYVWAYNGSCYSSVSTFTQLTSTCTTIYPHMVGALINSCDATGCLEGNNEILFFNSGTNSVSATSANIKVYYGTTFNPAANYTATYVANPTAVATLNIAAGCGTLFVDALTAGIIPAHSLFFITSNGLCNPYNFSNYCGLGTIYILFSQIGTWTAAGNFANQATIGDVRYFKTIINGNTINYDYQPCLLTVGGSTPDGTDGDGDAVTFPFAGGSANSYFNNGCNPSIVILPIELISFTGKYKRDVIELYWQTASEVNNDYFEIYKSTNLDFSRIGKVPGAGNSNSVLFYNFVDDNPIYGNNYYRLIQVDFDGHSSQSDIISVRVGENNINTGDKIEIYDIAGRKLPFKLNEYNMIEGLSFGLYVIVVNGTSSLKFITN